MRLDFFSRLMQHEQLAHPHKKQTLIMLKKRLLLPLLFFLTSQLGCAFAADLDREKHVAESIKDSIVVGDVLMLQSNGAEFIGLVNLDHSNTNRGLVIVLHGMGSNPNAPQIIAPLRDQLAELGWISLAIQLPLAPTGASIDDYLALINEASPRIQAAVDYSRNTYPSLPCFIVAHSLGAVMATQYLSTQQESKCQAAVMIGLPTLASDLPEAQSLSLLEKIQLPVLDIYGSQDLASVQKTASSRAATIMESNPLSRQVEIIGADHSFTGLDEVLIRAIHSWLSQIIEPDTQIKKTTN